MKLNDDARQQGVRSETAWRGFRDGKIKGHRVGLHTIIIDEARPNETKPGAKKVAVSACVSPTENKTNLDAQAERFVSSYMARGYQRRQGDQKVGSGINNPRPTWLADHTISTVVVEHRDPATRFGAHSIERLLAGQGRT
jgi:predicted site-specific integrase-resolvase